MPVYRRLLGKPPAGPRLCMPSASFFLRPPPVRLNRPFCSYFRVVISSSSKLATKMNNQLSTSTVGVFVQVNTSGEQNKNGLEPDSVLETVQHIRQKCPRLKFSGLMTIGNLGNSLSAVKDGGNPDFQTLREVRRKVSQELNVPESEIELSMGMSNDFEEAIKCGSTNVRVGSSIFGARDYASKNSPPVTNTTNEELIATQEKLEKATI